MALQPGIAYQTVLDLHGNLLVAQFARRATGGVLGCCSPILGILMMIQTLFVKKHHRGSPAPSR